MSIVAVDYGELFEGIGESLVWGLVAIALLSVGYWLIDLMTPGNLTELIHVERSVNAAVVVASGLLGIGIVIASAIVAAPDDFSDGLVNAAGYGLAGIVLVALSFVVLDRLSPGDLRAVVAQREHNPAVWVVAANHLAVGGIMAAAIS